MPYMPNLMIKANYFWHDDTFSIHTSLPFTAKDA